MKTRRRLLAAVLSLTLIFTSVNVLAVMDVEKTDDSEPAYDTLGDNRNNYNKIHFCLDKEEYGTIDNAAELSEATEYLISSAFVDGINNLTSLSESDASEKIDMVIEFESGFRQTEEFISLSAERETLETPEDIHEWRSRLNAFSEEYHSNLIKQSLDVTSNQSCSSIDVIGYSPFVILNTTVSDIDIAVLTEMSESDKIENIYISFEPELAESYEPETAQPLAVEYASSWDNALKGVNAYDIVKNGKYTGKNINIGIYEGGNVCFTSHPNLKDKNIVVKRNLGYTNDGIEHANMVTSVAALIAPKANFYVENALSYIDESNHRKTIFSDLSWFIQNECDIINCSFSYYNYLSYSFIDAIFDYQVYNHYITLIKSSGNVKNNAGKKNIASPSYTHNAIVVSGVTRSLIGNWSFSDETCYVTEGKFLKPTIAAPYYFNFPEFDEPLQGTSVSTPIVTGCVALLMQSNWDYMIYPEMVLSALISSAKETSGYSRTRQYFDEKVGAGMIDLEKAINSTNYSIVTMSGSSPASKSFNVNLTSGRTACFGLAWSPYVTPVYSNNVLTGSTTYVSDYDLLLYDSNNNLVAYSQNNRIGNMELIRYKVPKTGTYRIVISCFLKYTNGDEDVALTYNY